MAFKYGIIIDNVLYTWNGTEWQNLGDPATNYNQVTMTKDDIENLSSEAKQALLDLAKGHNIQLLIYNDGNYEEGDEERVNEWRINETLASSNLKEVDYKKDGYYVYVENNSSFSKQYKVLEWKIYEISNEGYLYKDSSGISSDSISELINKIRPSLDNIYEQKNNLNDDINSYLSSLLGSNSVLGTDYNGNPISISANTIYGLPEETNPNKGLLFKGAIGFSWFSKARAFDELFREYLSLKNGSVLGNINENDDKGALLGIFNQSHDMKLLSFDYGSSGYLYFDKDTFEFISKPLTYSDIEWNLADGILFVKNKSVYQFNLEGYIYYGNNGPESRTTDQLKNEILESISLKGLATNIGFVYFTESDEHYISSDGLVYIKDNVPYTINEGLVYFDTDHQIRSITGNGFIYFENGRLYTFDPSLADVEKPIITGRGGADLKSYFYDVSPPPMNGIIAIKENVYMPIEAYLIGDVIHVEDFPGNFSADLNRIMWWHQSGETLKLQGSNIHFNKTYLPYTMDEKYTYEEYTMVGTYDSGVNWKLDIKFFLKYFHYGTITEHNDYTYPAFFTIQNEYRRMTTAEYDYMKYLQYNNYTWYILWGFVSNDNGSTDMKLVFFRLDDNYPQLNPNKVDMKFETIPNIANTDVKDVVLMPNGYLIVLSDRMILKLYDSHMYNSTTTILSISSQHRHIIDYYSLLYENYIYIYAVDSNYENIYFTIISKDQLGGHIKDIDWGGADYYPILRWIRTNNMNLILPFWDSIWDSMISVIENNIFVLHNDSLRAYFNILPKDDYKYVIVKDGKIIDYPYPMPDFKFLVAPLDKTKDPTTLNMLSFMLKNNLLSGFAKLIH